MAVPSWAYNRIIRNVSTLNSVIKTMDPMSKEYQKLNSVIQSLNGLAVVLKKKNGR